MDVFFDTEFTTLNSKTGYQHHKILTHLCEEVGEWPDD